MKRNKNFTPLNKKIHKANKSIKENFIAKLVFSFFVSSLALTILIISYLFYLNIKGEHYVVSKFVKAASSNSLNEDRITILNEVSKSNKPNLKQSDIVGISMLFTSLKYGIDFNYLTNWRTKLNLNEETPKIVVVSRNKNKICLSYNVMDYDTNCSQGQFIEVISKDIGKTFKESVTDDFLSSKIICNIETHIDREYEIAEVFPQNLSCLGDYAEKNRRVFFQYSPKVPNKYVLVSLNDYFIYADANFNPWEKTLNIFKVN